MAISVEARIWLATHLLYPNSTQAFDVYQAIVVQSERAIRNSDFKYLLVKLSQICEKIPAVSSSLSFHVFENKPIDEWKNIFRKTQKIQQLILVGILVFELPLEQVATIFKVTLDKARFLFHQALKKVVQLVPETKVKYEFRFKKTSDQKISYLFTNENLIDYALGSLPKNMENKVELGIKQFPSLQASLVIYKKVFHQIKDLVNDQELFMLKAPIELAAVPFEISPTSERLKLLSQYKKPISISTVSIILMALVFIRPRWVENLSSTTKNQAFVLQEIKKPQMAVEETEPKPASTVVATNSSRQAPTPVIVLSKSSKPVAVEKPVAKSKPANIEVKKQGGVFRGILTVNDLDEVTPKIIDKIVNLGGKKAGEVELGWKKSPKVGYYHFTLPQDSVESVNQYLKLFGDYKVVFENHPRLLPPGTKRFIIEVVEGE